MTTNLSPAHDDAVLSDPALVLINQNRLAEMLGCSARTLERQRLEGTGIPFCRVGRLVRYRLVDVIEYLEAQRRWSTSEPPSTQGKKVTTAPEENKAVRRTPDDRIRRTPDDRTGDAP